VSNLRARSSTSLSPFISGVTMTLQGRGNRTVHGHYPYCETYKALPEKYRNISVDRKIAAT
jgi:hypothetical protein